MKRNGGSRFWPLWVALVVTSAVSCSSPLEVTVSPSTDSTPNTATDTAPSASDAAGFVRSSVDTTMAQTSFSIDASTQLTLGAESVALTERGSVDYSNVIADVVVELDNSGDLSELTMLADGVTMWAKSPQTNDMFVEGDASRLRNAASFQQSGLIGAFYMLRAATDVEVGDSFEVDGVSGREYRSSFTYDEAVAAAGAQATEFSSAFSLTGAATSAKLNVVVWIGDDNIVRNFRFDIEHEGVSGGGDAELRQVGQPVTPPTPPPADQTITGEEADAILDQIIG